MDYEARISKIEVRQEMQQKDIECLYQAIDELRRLMLERFDRTDLSICELRKYTDLKISELQIQLDEVRKEVNVNMRWMIGMWLTTMSMIAGLGGRVFGMY